MRRYALVLLALVTAAARAEWAIDVHDPWIRYIPGDRPMAGYFVVENKGRTDRNLTGASSPLFSDIQVHETVERDGTTSMRPAKSVAVPAGGSIEFAPGGFHLMLMQRRKDLQVGDRVPVALEFEDGGSQSAVFVIKPAWQE